MKKIFTGFAIVSGALYVFVLYYTLFRLVGREMVIASDDMLKNYNYWNSVNLIPFKTIIEYTTAIIDGSIRGAAIRNLFGNLVLFFPVGFYLPFFIQKMGKFKIYSIVVAASIIVIEVVQLATKTGSLDIDDFILNFVGAAFGFVVFKYTSARKLLNLCAWRRADRMNSKDEYIKKVTVGESKPHNGIIALEEYNLDWPVLFKRESERICEVLGDKALQIHHVGSTSVPCLCAKPIIDILLMVVDSSDEPSYIPDLETAGYKLQIREPGWFEHRLLKGPGADINLHVFSENASEIDRMLAFRDWLRSHEDDRRKYGQIKRKLARRTWKYVQHYADAKTEIIEEIMTRALEGGNG